MAGTPNGRFCWYELMTTDPDAAVDFYGRVAGWTTAPWGEGEKPYTMWMNGETPIGGVMELPEEGVPPCWLAYVSTPDVDAANQQVKALGGKILKERAIPQVGRISVVQDPQGGVLSIIEPEGDAPGHDDMAAVGEFSWHELATSDWEAAWRFYSQMFGWQEASQMDMPEGMGIYHMFSRGAHPLGGMFNLHSAMPIGWAFYVRVPDTHAAVETIKELGGEILNGPMEVPGGDFVAQCKDPQGVVFAVHSTAAQD